VSENYDTTLDYTTIRIGPNDRHSMMVICRDSRYRSMNRFKRFFKSPPSATFRASNCVRRAVCWQFDATQGHVYFRMNA